MQTGSNLQQDQRSASQCFASQVFGALTEEDPFDAALQRYAQCWPDLVFGWQTTSARTHIFESVKGFNYDEAAVADFMEVAENNPIPPLVEQNQHLPVFYSERYITPKEFERTDVYNAVFRKRDERNRMWVAIAECNKHSMATFSAHFSKSMRTRELSGFHASFQEMQRSLSAGFSLYLAIQDRKRSTSNAQHWLEALPVAALVLSESGRIEELNTPARHLIESNFSFQLGKGGVLEFTTPSASSDFANRLKFVCARNIQEGPFRLAGVPTTTVCFMVPMTGPLNLPTFVTPFLPSTSKALVYFIEPNITAPDRPEILSKTLGLTERESAVLLSLINGNSLRETAEVLGITYNTARNHMATATDKAGTSSQTAIVKMGTQILSRIGAD